MTFENKESDSNIINICIHEELDTVSISNQKQLNPINKIFYKSSIKMNEIIDNSIDLIITSPPYFNIKDYSKNGYQNISHSKLKSQDLGSLNNYNEYIEGLLKVWKECYRVLKPNGKLCINVPLMPMLKKI